MLSGKKKLIFAVVINIILVIMEIVGLFLSVGRHGIKVFKFYTENSNYFALIVCLTFVIGGLIAIAKGKNIAGWIHVIRFISTACLTVTLVVVLFVLIPMFPNDALFMLFGNSNLYQHTLCPIISILSFIFLENDTALSRRSIILAIFPTIIYGVICITLNFCRVMEGPYPFFYVYEFPWYASILFLTGILIGAIVIARVLYAIHNRKGQKLNV